MRSAIPLLLEALDEFAGRPKALLLHLLKQAGVDVDPNPTRDLKYTVSNRMTAAAVFAAMKNVGFKMTSSSVTNDGDSFAMIHDRGLDVLVSGDSSTARTKNPKAYVTLR